VRPSPLHVTNGDSAGNTLRQTALGGAVLPWQDVLHEGPVPAGPRRELLQARAAFLSACGWGSRRSILASLEDRDRQLVQALKDGQQVVLWFEHDLYDQLQLIDVLALAAPDTPELIVVGSFPGRPAFRGLGELTADELETLWPARVSASQDRVGTVAARQAFRQGQPTASSTVIGTFVFLPRRIVPTVRFGPRQRLSKQNRQDSSEGRQGPWGDYPQRGGHERSNDVERAGDATDDDFTSASGRRDAQLPARAGECLPDAEQRAAAPAVEGSRGLDANMDPSLRSLT